jgi:putative endonuclease
MNKCELGRKGEKEAKKYLEKLGYIIARQNFKCAYGEIDIIAIDGNDIVFIEVKTRCSKKFGEARESVNTYKRKHIKKATAFFIYKYKLENKYIKFDVIEVYKKSEKYVINHIKNVLW